ncbi:uncharacterized protein LOC142373403 isoform X2 [Odontesthes bonariensis]|uniref:uncharacterized protein LOC142373403 isoform X2 n=1 Tax=Odontesthes bonariensis TaxID=219752 RepID=UPI003F58DEAD
MRSLVPLFVFLAVAGFHSALSASLETLEKEEKSPQFDGLADLQKIDLMEFEAAQKTKAAQINVTEEQNEEDGRYLEAAQDGSVEEHVKAVNESTEGAGNSEAAAHEGETRMQFMYEPVGGSKWQLEKVRVIMGDKGENLNAFLEHHETVTETVSSLDEASQDSSKEQGPRMHRPCPERCYRLF